MERDRAEDAAWIGRGIDSDEKVRLIAFFRRNPGVIETIDGLSRRLALPRARLESQIHDVVSTGLLRERRIGDRVVVMVDRERLDALTGTIEEMLKRKARDVAGGA